MNIKKAIIYLFVFNTILSPFSYARRVTNSRARKIVSPTSNTTTTTAVTTAIESEPILTINQTPEIIKEEETVTPSKPSLLDVMQKSNKTISSTKSSNTKNLINEIKQRYIDQLDETKNSCSSIAKELDAIRSLATGTTVLSGIGILASGTALGVGIGKSNIDKKDYSKELEELENQNKTIEQCIQDLKNTDATDYTEEEFNKITLEECMKKLNEIKQKNCIISKLDECSQSINSIKSSLGLEALKLEDGTPRGYKYLYESGRDDFCATPQKPVYGVGSNGQISESLEWMFPPEKSCLQEKGFTKKILTPEKASTKLETCMQNLALFREIKESCTSGITVERIKSLSNDPTTCTKIDDFSLDNVCNINISNFKYSSTCSSKYNTIQECTFNDNKITLAIGSAKPKTTENFSIESLEEQKQKILDKQDKDLKTSKTLGNIRSAGLGVATLTSAASTGTSAVNIGKATNLIEKIKKCNNSIVKLKTVGAELQVELEAANQKDLLLNTITAVNQNCFSLDTKTLEKVKNLSIGSTVTSAIGTGTGAAGTVTSIMANTDKVRDNNTPEGKKKERNLNMASNILAGVTMGTSAASTALGGITTATIKKEDIEKAYKCEQALSY